ncbi:MAG TPA: hypothetical protein ENJ50_05805 [Planctomycetaceae bacterium]|nr:hypothetical protein [Planctomycetaceae bacterium]
MVKIPTYLIDGSPVCRRQAGVIAWFLATLLLSGCFFFPIRAVMHTAFCCQESSERSVPCEEETDAAEDTLWGLSEQARRRTTRRVGRASVASMAFALHDLLTNRQRRTGLPLQERYYLLSGLLASLRL